MKKAISIITVLVLLSLHAADITRNGKAVADIAIPDNAVSSVKFAAEELQKFIKIVSGARLDIVKESSPRKFKNRIYLGCKAAPEDKSVFAWRVKADAENLYLHGNDREIYEPEKLDLHDRIREWRISSSGTLLAVYDFLDKELGVYYIRPGDQGIVAPPQKNISVKPVDREGKPRLISAGMSIGKPIKNYGGWKDFKFADDFIRECRLWTLRNGMVDTYWFPGKGHSFVDYWKRFSKSHPEYFALLIDGTRRPLPGNRNGRHIPMCLSNEGLQNRLVGEWAAKRSRWHEGRWNWISACPNDVPEMCTCSKCRSWDGPNFKPLTDTPYWGDKKIPHSGKRFTDLGIYEACDENLSVTDRYCRFLLEIQKKARKFNPAVKIYGHAYADHVHAPDSVKLNEDILITYVGTPLFPMEPQKMAESKARWEKWMNAGCMLGYRPNATWAFGCFPYQYTKPFCTEYRMVLQSPKTKMVFFDALRCEFSSQGLMYYTIARLTQHPEKTLEEIADEFFAVFGKAGDDVRKYYAYWEKISDSITWKDVRKWEKKSGLGLNIFTYGDFSVDVLKMQYFTESAEILASAARNADTARAKAEVKFLQLGHKHAMLTLRMQIARLKSLNAPTTANKNKFRQYYQELTAFRNANEKYGISDMGRLCHYEKHGFSKSRPVKSK